MQLSWSLLDSPPQMFCVDPCVWFLFLINVSTTTAGFANLEVVGGITAQKQVAVALCL